MMKKRIKKISIVIGTFLAIIALAVTGIVSYLGTNQAQRRVLAGINRSIPGEITWEKLDFSIFPGRFEIQKPALRSPDGEIIARVGRIYLNLSWVALLNGEIRAQEIRIEQPEARLQTDAEGRLNLLQAFPEADSSAPEPETKGLPFNIALDALHLTEGGFRFAETGADGPERETRHENGLIQISGIELAANGINAAKASGSLEFSVKGGRVDLAGVHSDIRPVRLTAGMENGVLTAFSLNADSEMTGLKMDGSGKEILNDPRLDVNLAAETTLERIRDTLRINTDMTGPVRLTLKAAGTVGNPDAELRLDYDGGIIFAYPLEGLRLACRLRDRRLEVSEFEIKAPAARLTLTGNLDMRPAFPDGFLGKQRHPDAAVFDLDLTGTGVDLTQLTPVSAGLSGIFEADVHLKGKGLTGEGIQAEADVEIASDDFSVAGKPPFRTRLAVSGGGGLKAVQIRSLTAEMPGAELTGTGSTRIGERRFEAEIKLAGGDLSEALKGFGLAMLQGRTELNASLSGAYDQPEVRLNMDAKGLRYDEITLGDLRLAADLDAEGRVRIGELMLQNQDSQLKAAGEIAVLSKGFKPVTGFPATLDVSLQGVELGDFLPTPPLAGNFSGVIQLREKLLSPKIDGSIDGHELAVGEYRLGELAAALHFSEGTVDVRDAVLTSGDSRITLAGTAKVLSPELKPLNDPGFDLRLEGEKLELARISEKLGGILSLSGDISGTLSAPVAYVSLKGGNIRIGENRLGDVTAKADLADGMLSLAPFSIQNGESRISVTGTARVIDTGSGRFLKDPDLDMKIGDSRIHPADFNEDLKGVLAVSGAVTGALTRARADLTLKGEDLSAASYSLGDVAAALRYASGRLDVEKAVIRNGKSALDVSGSIRLLKAGTLEKTDDPEFDLRVAGETLFLEDFAKNMRGALAVKGQMGGSLAHPNGEFRIDGKEIDLGVQRIDGVRFSSRMDGERVNIDRLLLAMAPGEEIVTDGWVAPFRRRYDLRMKTDGVSLKHIDAARDGMEKGRFSEGRIAFSLAGKGSFDDPRMNGEVRIFGVKLNQQVMEDLKLRLEVKDQVAQITGKIDCDIDATYHLKTKDFSAKALFDNTDLAPFFSAAGRDDLKGALSGELTASGNAGRPKEIQANLSISRIDVRLDQGEAGDVELIRGENLQAVMENQRISAKDFRLSLLKEGSLEISGQGSLDGLLDFKARGRIPMATARIFNEDLYDIKGDIDLNARLEGKASDPDYRADLTLSGIGLTVPGLAQQIRDLHGAVHVTRDALELAGIRGFLDKGEFILEGRVGLEKFQPSTADVALRAIRLPIQVPDTAEVMFNADLNLKGTSEKSVVGGEISLLEGVYFKEMKLNLLDAIGKKTRKGEAPKQALPPFVENMAFDVKIRHRNPLMVDNNIALMNLKPDLHLTGPVSAPVVNGRAEVENGTLFYQDREFEITKGVIDFVNPYRIEPDIDIEGEAEIRDWTVFMAVTGTTENLKLALRSDPPEEHGDILSLIALGKTTRELTSGDGEGSSAKQLVADILAEKLGERLQESTALDSVELEYQEGKAAEENDRVRVTVGKELSRRMSVKYGVETRDGETVQRVTAEYKFLERLLMSAFQDTQGAYGGELIFRLEFR